MFFASRDVTVTS